LDENTVGQWNPRGLLVEGKGRTLRFIMGKDVRQRKYSTLPLTLSEEAGGP